ncbi:hypothetical protein KIN20_032456 [Parelaphostrongylus tenuis]|uniref:Uncharacterized protein n=1 Tax=Parelaphostrongylus tenuis TaxID=148309 RepID=A0AAD5WI30_PARTN|nr:hypothetical protein KIN20_032456 [Parelaphostrongylus tenuis]
MTRPVFNNLHKEDEILKQKMEQHWNYSKAIVEDECEKYSRMQEANASGRRAIFIRHCTPQCEQHISRSGLTEKNANNTLALRFLEKYSPSDILRAPKQAVLLQRRKVRLGIFVRNGSKERLRSRDLPKKEYIQFEKVLVLEHFGGYFLHARKSVHEPAEFTSNRAQNGLAVIKLSRIVLAFLFEKKPWLIRTLHKAEFMRFFHLIAQMNKLSRLCARGTRRYMIFFRRCSISPIK